MCFFMVPVGRVSRPARRRNAGLLACRGARNSPRPPRVAPASVVIMPVVNWKLVLQLSMFGLAMGFATVFMIPSKIEPAFWLVIFLYCAYTIARQCPKRRFAHGLWLGIVNSVWITTAHILLFNLYLASHPQEAEMMNSMPVPNSGKLLMALIGGFVGCISGVVIGTLAVIAGKVLEKRAPNAAART